METVLSAAKETSSPLRPNQAASPTLCVAVSHAVFTRSVRGEPTTDVTSAVSFLLFENRENLEYHSSTKYRVSLLKRKGDKLTQLHTLKTSR